MADLPGLERFKRLETNVPIWNRFFNVAPLVLIGTKEKDSTFDFAPKHMSFPLGWLNFFGFVCSPNHHTYHNAQAAGRFTVSYPRPSQVLLTSMAATPRDPDGRKLELSMLPTVPAPDFDGVFLKDAYLFLCCTTERVIDGFGNNSIVTGRIVDAYVDERFLRLADRDDQDLVHHEPILAYLHPGRYAQIESSFSFPFTVDMRQ